MKEKKTKKVKEPKPLQLEDTLEESLVSPEVNVGDEKEVIIKTFTPKERKDSNKTIHKGWYEPMPPKIIHQLLISMEQAYNDQKNHWETEERISKARKEYLQNLYDRLGDIKIVHAQQNK